LNTSRRHDASWMLAHFTSPQSVSPGSAMAPVDLKGPQLNDLAAAMLALTPDNGDITKTAPAFVVEGAATYQKNFCSACHMVNGVGGKTGPALNGLSSRRTEAWTIEHFQNPQKVSPGTPMPPYRFSATEMQSIVSYLFTLPDQAPGQ
jgi:nitric oxide reductase subunit C